MTSYSLTIDAGRCSGHGRCYGLAPQLFDCDDLGQGLVLTPSISDADDVEDASNAVETCPEHAIALSRLDGPSDPLQ